MNRLIRSLSLLSLALFFTVAPLPNQPTASAHGGVIIDGGTTEHYEWIAMASPFPVTPGETILTVLIYDIETYAPIDGLMPTLELARPDAPRPCCTGDDTIGPMSLLVDPVLYPGDYSNIILMLQEGNWQGKFTIDAADPIGPGELVEIFFEVDVREQAQGEERPTPIQADIISLTATAVASEGNPSIANQPSVESSMQTGVETDDTAYPIPQLVPQNNLAPTGTATPYPAPLTSTAPAGPEANAPTAQEPEPVAGFDAAPDVQTPAGDGTTTERESGGPSWASENIWLLAALALVPLLLIVVWLAMTNSSANEWSGDKEEDR